MSCASPRRKLTDAVNTDAPLRRRNGLGIASKLPWEPRRRHAQIYAEGAFGKHQAVAFHSAADAIKSLLSRTIRTLNGRLLFGEADDRRRRFTVRRGWERNQAPDAFYRSSAGAGLSLLVRQGDRACDAEPRGHRPDRNPKAAAG